MNPWRTKVTKITKITKVTKVTKIEKIQGARIGRGLGPRHRGVALHFVSGPHVLGDLRVLRDLRDSRGAGLERS